MSVQGTETWKLARVGRATASRFADVLATIKSGEAASRRNYRAQLVTERLTGLPVESYQSAEMRWGIECEPYAREAYSVTTGQSVMQVGFIEHGELAAGCSPDGLVGDDGLLECKCPNTATHIDTLLAGGKQPDYMAQVQGQLWISDRKWCDLVSFDPRMPPKLQLVVWRVERDEAYIARLEEEVARFLSEVDATVGKLVKLAA